MTHRRTRQPVMLALLALLLIGVWGGVVVDRTAHAQAAQNRHRLAPQQQPGQIIDLQTYESWLREALVAARRSDRPGLQQAADRLLEVEAVRLAEGDAVPVDNGWLAAALDEPDPDFDLIAERLGALVDALAQPDPSAPADAQQRLRDLLSRPPFAENRSSDNLLTRFLNWLFDLLDRLLGPAFDVDTIGFNPAERFGWFVSAISTVLLVGVLAYLLLKTRRALTSEARAREPEDPEAGLTASSALQQASTLARGGDYRTAVRYLYLSSLLWLDERGMLRYDRALTNREYLERLSDNPDLRARLLPIVDTFDRVWYGHLPLDEESFQTYQRQVEELRHSR